MFDMYQGFAAYKDWDFEVLNYTNADYGESRICLIVCYLFDSGVYGILAHFWLSAENFRFRIRKKFASLTSLDW